MPSAADMQSVEDRATIMSAMIVWRNAFWAEGSAMSVGQNELCRPPIWVFGSKWVNGIGPTCHSTQYLV